MTVFPTATLFEASGGQTALPSDIKPVVAGWRIAGPAFPVQGPPGDNLWLHRAIYAASPGDILVVHVGDHHEAGYWGEIMSTAAQVRGLGGLVIDGCVRDARDLAEVGFPVFSRGLCIRGTGKDRDARGTLGQPVTIGGVTVMAGDLIVGDDDGVVAIRADRIAATLDRAAARTAKEAAIVERLKRGETTLAIYDLA
jgi:4-hydroxy-4-methyl-2-oxoglutarate aldolase